MPDEEFQYVNADNVPRIVPPASDGLSDTPAVIVKHHEGVPYVGILDLQGDQVFDITCTDALNLAMLLIQGAGDAQARRIDRVEGRVAVYHMPNGTIGVYNS